MAQQVEMHAGTSVEEILDNLKHAYTALDNAQKAKAQALKNVSNAIRSGMRTGDIATDYMLMRGHVPWRSPDHDPRKDMLGVHSVFAQGLRAVEGNLATGVPVMVGLSDGRTLPTVALFGAYVRDASLVLGVDCVMLPATQWYALYYADLRWDDLVSAGNPWKRYSAEAMITEKRAQWVNPDAVYFKGAYDRVYSDGSAFGPNEFTLMLPGHGFLAFGQEAIVERLAHFKAVYPVAWQTFATAQPPRGVEHHPMFAGLQS